jgi:hypothetical protein
MASYQGVLKRYQGLFDLPAHTKPVTQLEGDIFASSAKIVRSWRQRSRPGRIYLTGDQRKKPGLLAGRARDII